MGCVCARVWYESVWPHLSNVCERSPLPEALIDEALRISQAAVTEAARGCNAGAAFAGKTFGIELERRRGKIPWVVPLHRVDNENLVSSTIPQH